MKYFTIYFGTARTSNLKFELIKVSIRSTHGAAGDSKPLQKMLGQNFTMNLSKPPLQDSKTAEDEESCALTQRGFHATVSCFFFFINICCQRFSSFFFPVKKKKKTFLHFWPNDKEL